MKKGITSVVLVTLMYLMFGFSTLYANGQNDQNGNSNKSFSDSYGLEDATLPLSAPVTLKFLTKSSPLAPADPNEKLINQRLEKETNIHIEWTNYTWDSFVEKRNLDIASMELPDAIFDAELQDYDILSYAADGVIIPLEDLIDEYMPNLKGIFDKYPAYRKMTTASDGHIYSFPWIEELGSGRESIHSIDCIPWINTAWLKNVGLDMPTTIDELTTVLRAFKTMDANGNGDSSDEIPMSFIFDGGGENFLSLLGAFGYGDNGDHTVVTNEGDVIFTPAHDGYKEGIKWMQLLFSEGLIDVEAFTHEWSQYLAKGSTDKYGVYFTWDSGNISGFESGDYSDPDNIVSDVAPLPMVSGPDGWKNATRTNNLGYDRGRMVITSVNQNVALTAKWIDKCYEPLQSAQNNWGTYGDEEQQNIFEMNGAGDFLSHLPLGSTSPWELRQKTFIGGPLAILDEYYGTYITMPDDAAWRLKILKDVYVPHMKMDSIYPKVFFSIEDQMELTNIELPMFEYFKSRQAEWIFSGGDIDAQWADYIEELKEIGLDRWLEIKQSYYNKF